MSWKNSEFVHLGFVKTCHELDISFSPDPATNSKNMNTNFSDYFDSLLILSCFLFFSTIWVWKFCETHLLSCSILKTFTCWFLGFSRIYNWSSWSSQDYILFLKFRETNAVKIKYFFIIFQVFHEFIIDLRDRLMDKRDEMEMQD